MSKPAQCLLDAGTKPEAGFEIREVYYDKNGEVESWTEDAIEPYGSSLEELTTSMELMAAAFEKPVLDLDELEKKQS